MLPALPLIILAPAPSFPSARRLPPAAFRARYRSRGGGLPGAGGGGSHARVLVRVGGYVGDELLRREGEQPRQGEGRRARRQSGEQEVVVRYGVGYLDVDTSASVLSPE